ncbi:MAG: CopG family transcriptional regulator [Proteobacteria bacterium]|nr:MAG: CopG family transcriptional regulator [Pseudomonadota bacterium]
MKTTLDIDDQILAALKTVARRTKRTLGEVVSDLARRALTPAIRVKERNGVPLFDAAAQGGPVTLALVNELGDGGAQR